MLNKIIKKILLFSPLIFLIYTPWTLYPSIFGRSVVFQIVIELILLVLILRSVFIRPIRPISPIGHIGRIFSIRQTFYSPIGVGLIVFTLAQFISFLFSVDREQSFWGSMSRMDGLFSWLHMVVFYFLLVLFFSSKEEAEIPTSAEADFVPEAPRVLRAQSAIRFFWINAVVAGILSVFAIIQHFHDLIPNYIIQSGRVYATFGNPIFFASYLIFSIFFSLFLLSPHLNPPPFEGGGRRGITKFVGLIGLTILQFVALWLTGSQGSIGGFLAGLVVVGVLFSICKLKKLWTRTVPEAPKVLRVRYALRAKYIRLIGLIGLTGLIVFIGFSKLGLDQFIKSPQISKIDGLDARISVWQMGIEGWRERPFLGFGPSTFEYVFDKYYKPELLRHSFYETVSNKPHNILVEVLAHNGIIGLISYLGIFFSSFYLLWRIRKTEQALSILGIGLLVAYFGALQFAFDTTNSLFMFMAFLAYITYSTKEQKNKRTEEQNISPPRPFSLLVFKFLCFSVLLLALWFGNIEAWRASVPAARSENNFVYRKPIKWGKEIARAVVFQSPYHDEIRVILGQDLIRWNALGTLPHEEIKDDIAVLISALEESARIHQNNFQYHFILSQVQSLYGEKFDTSFLEKAEASIKSSLAVSQNRQAAYLILGKVLLLKGDMTDAEKVALDAVNLYDVAADPHWFLGLTRVIAGRPEDGVKEFIRARELGYDFKPQEITYWMSINKRIGKEEDNKELQEFLEEKVKEYQR